MKRVILLLFLVPELVFADATKDFGYKYSKCVEGSAKYTKQLTYDEICKYSAACPSTKTNWKISMDCVQDQLSKCFENKAWQTEAEFVGVEKSIKIEYMVHSISYSNGKKTDQTCAYYN